MTDTGITHRKCNRCGLEKPVAEMVASAKYLGGYMPTCKPCRNTYWRMRRENDPVLRQKHSDAVLKSKMLHRYGMCAADYERMVLAQGNKCKLCGSTETGRSTRFRSWNVDHCHKTGRVRGLLCHTCNITLGKFEKLRDKVGVDGILAYLAPPE